MPVTPVKIIPDMRKSFEIEVKTTETTTLKKTIIIVDSRQDETRPSEISQIAPPSEREGGDDWFILFDIIREKPLVVPPGTFHCQRVCICLAIKIRQLSGLHQTSKSSSKYKILNEFVSYLFTFTLYVSCCG